MAVLPGAALKYWSVSAVKGKKPNGLICYDRPSTHEAMETVPLQKNTSQPQPPGVPISPQGSTWEAAPAGAAVALRKMQWGSAWWFGGFLLDKRFWVSIQVSRLHGGNQK